MIHSHCAECTWCLPQTSSTCVAPKSNYNNIYVHGKPHHRAAHYSTPHPGATMGRSVSRTQSRETRAKALWEKMYPKTKGRATAPRKPSRSALSRSTQQSAGRLSDLTFCLRLPHGEAQVHSPRSPVRTLTTVRKRGLEPV